MKAVYLLVGVCLLLTSLNPAQGPGKPGVPSPLNLSENIWFFGFIPKDAWVSHHYILTNPHRDTVTITKMVPSCDCTHVPPTPISIPPGESRPIKVLFATETYFGEINREVEVYTDQRPDSHFTLYFGSAVAVDPRTLRVTPRSIVFIAGKEKETIKVENLIDEETRVRIRLDHDSSLAVSQNEAMLQSRQSFSFDIRPIWDKLPFGPNYSCLTLEFIRKSDVVWITVPVKTNRF